MNDAGVKTEWRVLVGGNDFFQVTKKFHNGLQGEPVNLSDEKRALYQDTNEAFSQYTHIETSDVVVIHDPQPLPLISFYRKRQPWIWRCHLDLRQPNEALWDYLKGFLLRYDKVVLSDEAYAREDLPVTQVVMHPAIDPLAQKNIDLPKGRREALLAAAGIPLDKPLVTQVSRFDRLKDPIGVIKTFKLVRESFDCRLVLAGNAAIDDPESGDVLHEIQQAGAPLLATGDMVVLMGANDVTINALQRESSVVLQKSKREGFGLTVSEALWKGTPVVASAVGGIPLQLRDGIDGFLVEPNDLETAAECIARLLHDPDKAADMGLSGRERVRSDFLVTRLVGHWLALVKEVLDEVGC